MTREIEHTVAQVQKIWEQRDELVAEALEAWATSTAARGASSTIRT